jgi:hypothetical protein
MTDPITDERIAEIEQVLALIDPRAQSDKRGLIARVRAERAAGIAEERARWLAALPRCGGLGSLLPCANIATRESVLGGFWCDSHNNGSEQVDLPYAALVRESTR